VVDQQIDGRLAGQQALRPHPKRGRQVIEARSVSGGSFGSLDHEILVSTLAEHIHDGRFLQLIKRMLNAGYLEDWRWNATLSGLPTGVLMFS